MSLLTCEFLAYFYRKLVIIWHLHKILIPLPLVGFKKTLQMNKLIVAGYKRLIWFPFWLPLKKNSFISFIFQPLSPLGSCTLEPQCL